jgi:hypothetical protein
MKQSGLGRDRAADPAGPARETQCAALFRPSWPHALQPLISHRIVAVRNALKLDRVNNIPAGRACWLAFFGQGAPRVFSKLDAADKEIPNIMSAGGIYDADLYIEMSLQPTFHLHP